MFKFQKAQPAAAASMLTLSTPVQFDPSLVSRLIARTDALYARFGTMLCRLDDDPQLAEIAMTDCADQLQAIRRSESLWLYPVIAHGVEHDAPARTQLAQLRLAMLALARRALRRLDDMARALRTGTGVGLAAERATAALREYVQRNQAEIYPLYDAAGARSFDTISRAA